MHDKVDTPAGVSLPYFLTLLNTLWPDLEASRHTGVDTLDSVFNSIAYWENPLRHQARGIHWPGQDGYPVALFEPDPRVIQDTVLPLTHGLTAVLRTRPDMHDHGLDSAHGRARLLHWRLTLGCHEYRYLQFTPEEAAFLRSPRRPGSWFAPKVPYLADLLSPLYGDRPDVRDKLIRGHPRTLQECWRESGHLLMRALDKAEQVAACPSHDAPPPMSGRHEPHGINIIGFATGQFGVGEDTRMATRVAIQAGLDICVHEPSIPLHTAHRQSSWINKHLQPEPRFRVNLITLPATDTLRLCFLAQAGVLTGRYNICGWQWELPLWPSKWSGLMSIPDEIWAQSRYLQKVFSQATDKPVIYMPSAVEIPPFTPLSRDAFGMPAEPFTFLSVFDTNAWLERKNPLAAVRAFLMAFPPARQDVRLVVKMMNSRPELPAYQDLMRLCAADSRIIVIDKFLSREDMLALLNNADIFVSLHRAEGFGRVIAESMLLGKPVIATNFSGNTDFAFRETAYLVDGPMIPLRKGDYADHEGQFWMDPDIGLAAEAMTRCVEDCKGTQEMALRGQQWVSTHHGIESVARLYLARLEEIGAI